MASQVKVPTLGESITEATLGAWLKQPGEAVAQDEPIASLETDKVAIEVNAPTAGTMGKQLVAVGDNVAVGAVIAEIEAGAGAPAAALRPVLSDAAGGVEGAEPPTSTPVNPAGPGENMATKEAPAPSEEDEDGPHLTLSPAVRRIVLEHHLDPSKIKGTGKDGRLTKDDVLAAAAEGQKAEAPAPAPAAPAAASPPAPRKPGERREERVRMTRLRQTIAKRLKEAQNTAAMLTTFNDVDMSEIMAARARYKDLFEKKHGIRLGFMGFFVKAAALAAHDIPAVNASIEGEEIVYHDYLDVSVAVSAPAGPGRPRDPRRADADLRRDREDNRRFRQARARRAR